MAAVEMKIPKNQQSRLAPDVWLAGEAIARFRGMTSREAFEHSVRVYADRLAEQDPEFRKIWESVKAEGIESNE